jgi:hypothetical protein
MSKRVAVLLVRNLSEALRQRRIEVAESEPYWLRPEQYNERDGGVELLPAMADDLMAYARRNDLRPMGVVILNESGDYFDYINDGPISPIDREFAIKLFQVHAHFWFCYVPWLADKQTEA